MAIFRLNEDWSPFNRGAEFIEEGSGMYALKANPNVKAKIPAELLDEVDNGGYWVYCRISSNSDYLCDKGLCFDNEQQAEDSIKQRKEDWLVYLGVKEKSDDNS